MALISRLLPVAALGASMALTAAAPAGAANAGDLDSAFGSGGIVTTPAGDGGDAQGNALLQRADGSLVLVGTALDGAGGKIAVARYSAAGAFAGLTLTGSGFSNTDANAVAAQGTNIIVA